MRASVHLAIGLAVLAVLTLGGCQSDAQSVSPLQALGLSGESTVGPRTGVVVGVLGAPSNAPISPDAVSRGMSDELARTMLHDGSFDVWINPQLQAAAQSLLSSPSRSYEQRWEKLRRDYPDVQYLLSGRVTDFVHVNEPAPGESRGGWFSRGPEALVGIEYRIVDLRSRRTVASDLVAARAKAGDARSDTAYEGISFGSYRFWQTPLGQATRKTLKDLVGRLDRVLPSHLADRQIIERLSKRRVAIDGGLMHGLKSGQEFYLFRDEHPDEQRGPVTDAVTDRPIVIRIDRVDRYRSTGWVLGQPTAEVDLVGKRLRRVGRGMQTAAAEDEQRDAP